MVSIVVVDWIMREVEDQWKTIIQWNLTTHLHNLDCVDHIWLHSQTLKDVQAKPNNLALIEKNIGLRISKEKTNVIRINTKQEDKSS